MRGLGWILLANQLAGLPGFGEPTQPAAPDNQYGGHLINQNNDRFATFSCDFKVLPINTQLVLE